MGSRPISFTFLDTRWVRSSPWHDRYASTGSMDGTTSALEATSAKPFTGTSGTDSISWNCSARWSSCYGVQVHAYVLMNNHYHLLLQTPEANLSRDKPK